MADTNRFTVGIIPIKITESYLYGGIMGGPGLVYPIINGRMRLGI